MSRLSEAWAMKDAVSLPANSSKLAKTTAKPTAFRSEEFRRLVASIPCRHPGCNRIDVQASHRNQGKGMAIKGPDSRVFAACITHHHGTDSGNKVSKSERRAYENSMIVDTWAYIIENNMIALVVK